MPVADISKCKGILDSAEGEIHCWHRDRCYRFTAPAADVFQSWIAPVIRDDGSCAKFVDNGKDEDDGA